MIEPWTKVVFKNWPEVDKVTRPMLESCYRQGRLLRGCVRMMTGRMSTTDELEERRREAMKPLLYYWREPAIPTIPQKAKRRISWSHNTTEAIIVILALIVLIIFSAFMIAFIKLPLLKG